MIDTAFDLNTNVYFILCRTIVTARFHCLNVSVSVLIYLCFISFYYLAKCGLLTMEQHLAHPVLSSKTLVVLFSFYVFILCFVARCLLSDNQGWDTVIFLKYLGKCALSLCKWASLWNQGICSQFLGGKNHNCRSILIIGGMKHFKCFFLVWRGVSNIFAVLLKMGVRNISWKP